MKHEPSVDIDVSSDPDTVVEGIHLRSLGLVPYQSSWQAMREFTASRVTDTPDEIWLLQHTPVFTLGQAGKSEHVLAAGDIPLVNSDRGGQVTYHGPGQLLMYTMIDLKRTGFGIRKLVTLLENTVIDYLSRLSIQAENRADAPGVYVDGAKVAALGLRVSRGCSYHGLSFNIDMDLEPFGRINPCGFADLEVTSLSRLGLEISPDIMGPELAALFAAGVRNAANEKA